MKFEVGKTYLTRDGSKAVVLCVDAPNKQPVIVMHADGEASNHRADGGFYTDEFDGTAGYDLVSEYVEPPKPREVWIIFDGSAPGGRVTALRGSIKFREVMDDE